MPSLLRFADVELDLFRYELRRSQSVLKLERIPMDLLVFLVEQRGRLVTREEIIDRIWGRDVFLDTENAINTAIHKIRQVLKDDPAQPKLLETVPGKGYRFVGQVTLIEKAVAAAAKESASARPIGIEAPQSSRAGGPSQLPPAPLVQRLLSRKLILSSGALVAVLVFLVALGIVSRFRSSSARARPSISSLAVLPLENLSGDPSQEYFADGMTDELITELARIGALRVISRTSVMTYKKTHKPLSEIARELRVDAVIEGTVSRSGQRVRIRAQLVRAQPEENLWAQTYDSDVSDILAVQSKVAKEVAAELRIKLTPQEQERFAKARSLDPGALDAYLKGRHEWNKRDPEGLKKSIEYFQQAIDRDAAYARAWAGLADSYDVLTAYGLAAPEQSYPKARAAAQRALELDDTLGEAHATLASVKSEYEWDWPGAEKEFKRAIELNPKYATAHQWYSEYLLRTGQFDQALAEIRLARDLDPLSLIISAELGGDLYWARRYPEAIQQLRSSVQDHGVNYAHSWLGFAYAKQGMLPESVAEFQQAITISGGSPGFRAGLGYAFGLAGQKRKALQIAEQLKTQSKKSHVSPYDMALVYSGLEEKDQALQWLETAYRRHDPGLVMIKVEPALDILHSDRRFADLVRRVGLTP